MKLQTLLSGIRQSQNTKTASEAPASTGTPTSADSQLSVALRAAVTSGETVKVASAPATTPVMDVMKVAAELADADQALAVKEAQLLGAAFADSAVARFADWQKAAGAVQGEPMLSKVAQLAPSQSVQSIAAQADVAFAKFAEENPVTARQAIALGYAPTAGGLDKMAEDSYVQGYNDQVTEIHKVAADEFLKGAAMTSVLLERASKR